MKIITKEYLFFSIVLILNLLYLIIDLLFIYYFAYESKHAIIFYFLSYFTIKTLRNIFLEKMKLLIKNNILNSLNYSYQPDKLILNKNFRINFPHQIFSISKIFALLIKHTLPSTILLIFTTFLNFYLYELDLSLPFAIIISLNIPINTYSISHNLILNNLTNITSLKFWNISKNKIIPFLNKLNQKTNYIPIIAMYAIYCTYCYFNLHNLLLSLINIKASFIFIYSIRKIRGIRTSITNLTLINLEHKTKSYDLVFLNKKVSVEIENLTYFNDEYCAIDNLSISIKMGEIVLVTGHYGKTILLNIIAGLLWEYKGSVFINHLNIAYVLNNKNIAYIMELKSLFIGMTIKENILLQCTELIMPFEEILKFTNLNELTELFPNGVNTIVTENLYIPREIINKISIARAMAKLKTANVLLLDNPSNINHSICTKLVKNKKLIRNKIVIISGKGTEFLSITDRVLFINKGGKCHYNTRDAMPKEYYQFIKSNLYS